jgi:phosphomannomutase
VIVTGSHLAPELNGLKLVAGPSYGPVDIRELPEAPHVPASRPRGRLWREGTVAQEHVAAVCASVDVEFIRASRLSVDCAGGVGPAPALLLERLGCDSGAGHRHASFRLDADGDRLELGDERGVTLDTELALPLTLLAREARLVVKGADTSRVVDVLATALAGTVRTVPPGEIHLVRGLETTGGDLAGEGNGGVIVPGVGLARDGLAATASIISLLARRRTPLSALVAELPHFARRRSTIPCSQPARARACLEALARRLGVEPGEPDRGIEIEAGNGAWGLVRLSATEPVLRITAEAGTQREAEALHAELRAGALEGGSGH